MISDIIKTVLMKRLVGGSSDASPSVTYSVPELNLSKYYVKSPGVSGSRAISAASPPDKVATTKYFRFLEALIAKMDT